MAYQPPRVIFRTGGAPSTPSLRPTESPSEWGEKLDRILSQMEERKRKEDMPKLAGKKDDQKQQMEKLTRAVEGLEQRTRSGIYAPPGTQGGPVGEPENLPRMPIYAPPGGRRAGAPYESTSDLPGFPGTTPYTPPGIVADPRAADLGAARADAASATQAGDDSMQQVAAQQEQIQANQQRIQAQQIAQQQQAELQRQEQQLAAQGQQPGPYAPPPATDAADMEMREQQAAQAFDAFMKSRPITAADSPEVVRRAVEMMPKPVRAPRVDEAAPPPRVPQLATRMARRFFNTDTAHPVRRVAPDEVMLRAGLLPSGVVNPMSILGWY